MRKVVTRTPLSAGDWVKRWLLIVAVERGRLELTRPSFLLAMLVSLLLASFHGIQQRSCNRSEPQEVVAFGGCGLGILVGDSFLGGASGATVEPLVAPLPLRVNATTRMPSPAWPSPGLTLHVAPRGNDSGDGSATQPFASLERARDEIRVRRQRGSLFRGGVEVRVHGGEYLVSQTFLLSEGDSGTESAPVFFGQRPARNRLFVAEPGWRVGANCRRRMVTRSFRRRLGPRYG